NSFLTSARAFGHYIEQPMLIRKIAVGTGAFGVAGTGLLLGSDILKGKPGEERHKVIVRDALVMGATGIGTVLATRRWMPLPSRAQAVEEVEKLGEKLKGYGRKYADLLELEAFSKQNAQLSRAEFKRVVAALKARGGTAELNEVLPVGGDMTEVKHFKA